MTTAFSGAASGPTIGLVSAMWRRRWRLATLLAGTLLAGMATVTLALPGMHHATATLLLEHPGVPDGPGRPAPNDLETRVHTLTEEVLSRARFEAIVDRFGLYPELTSKGHHRAAVDRLWSDIRVKFKRTEPGIGRGTTVAIGITVRGRDSETVARVANELANGYLGENLRFRERGRLIRLKQELARMRKTYSDKYPDVGRLKTEIALAERQLTDGVLDREPRAVRHPARRFDVPEQPEPEHDLAHGEFRLLDPAIPDGKTAAPNRLRLVLIGIAFAIFTTVATVLLAERLDGSFHTVDDLRRFTKIPVVACIPSITTAVHVSPWRRWAAVVLPAAGVALVVLAAYFFAHGNEQLVWLLSGWRLKGLPPGAPVAF